MGKYLVTGVAGFVGAHLARRLLLNGHEVVGVDNLDSAYDRRLKMHRFGWLDGLDGFTFYERNILDLNADYFKNRYGVFDAILHLAGRAGVRQSVADPMGYIGDNVLGQVRMLDLVRRGVASRLVYASSSSVYTPTFAGDGELTDGARGLEPSRVDFPFIADAPRTPYAASKRAIELIAEAYARSYDVPSLGLRFFSVYGPAGRPDSRASVFQYVRQVAEGLPITVYSPLEQRRDFTHIDDVVRVIVAEAERDPSKTFPVADLMNVGSGRPERVVDVIEGVARILGKKAAIEQVTDPRTDTAFTYSTPLPFEPVPLEVGLRGAVNWYLENRAWAREVAP